MAESGDPGGKINPGERSFPGRFAKFSLASGFLAGGLPVGLVSSRPKSTPKNAPRPVRGHDDG
jgi:hypothetical protein